MDINYTAEERAFRDEVRTFLNEKLPKDISSNMSFQHGGNGTREPPISCAAHLTRSHRILTEAVLCMLGTEAAH